MNAQEPQGRIVVACEACNRSVDAEDAKVGGGIIMCLPCDEDFNENMARLNALAEETTPPPTPETVGIA